jgi:hypothetical protein
METSHIQRRKKPSFQMMYRLIMDGTETYSDPADPGKDATPGQVAVYKMLYAEARKNRLQYGNDKFKVFILIMGQCTTTNNLETKVGSHP